MQPVYITLSSTGSSPWKQTNWQISPMNLSFSVVSTGGSSWFISATLEDPTGTYPSPISSAPTPFTIITGSSNILVSVGSTVVAPAVLPITGYQFTLNTISSVGAKVNFIALQSGIG